MDRQPAQDLKALLFLLFFRELANRYLKNEGLDGGKIKPQVKIAKPRNRKSKSTALQSLFSFLVLLRRRRRRPPPPNYEQADRTASSKIPSMTAAAAVVVVIVAAAAAVLVLVVVVVVVAAVVGTLVAEFDFDVLCENALDE